MDKLGTKVSPLDVMQGTLFRAALFYAHTALGGNQNQHAVWNGVEYASSTNTR